MKDRILILFLIAALVPATLGAGELRKIADGPLGPLVDAPSQQVFVNLLGFAYGTPTLGYERMLNYDNSFTGQIGFHHWGGSGYSLNYLGLLGSYRWWLGHHAKLQGLYVGPLATVEMVSASYDVTTINGNTTTLRRDSGSAFIGGIGAEGGFQWVLANRITFGLGLNLAYSFGSFAVAEGGPSFTVGGFGPGLNGTVGYAF